MPYIGPLNTSEGARKSDFDFDYLSQHPTTGYTWASVQFLGNSG